jgi:signal transduction histidine kinase
VNLERVKSVTGLPAATAPCVTPALLGLLLALSGLFVAQGQISTNQVLRFADQVRRLSPEQAGKHLPVLLKAVVTFHDERLYSRFVQDETAGIYLMEMTNNMPPFETGQLVEIEGETGAGEYAPIDIPRSVRVLGQSPLPAAKVVSAEELVSGREDSQFVEVVGTVRSVRFEQESQFYMIDLVMGGERFTALASQLPVTNTEELVESVVRLRGVCTTQFNRQRQLFGFRLLVPREADLTIEKPASANPFDIPTQGIGSLLRFTAQGTFGSRVKVEGTVVYHEAGAALFIQDQGLGLYCQTLQQVPLQNGDRVEVLGFPAKGEYTPILQDATYRKTGQGAALTTVNISLDEALAGTFDCRLVRITGNLLEHTQRGREQFIVLERDGFIFYAYLAHEEGTNGFSPADIGSVVAVTGICLIERGSFWRAGEDWRAKSFRILLQSAADVVILKYPSWLNLRRVLWISCALLFIALAASAWVAILRRQVAERTMELEAQILERQRFERQHLIEQERSRVAQDLHDELGSTLTEVSMLGSLARTPSLPPGARDKYLEKLTHSSRAVIATLDEIVWAVNPKYDSVASLASYYSLYAQRFLNLAGIACRLQVADTFPVAPLDSRMRHGVFLAFKEALNNAVRHSGASSVRIGLEVAGNQLKVSVVDDGKGFDVTQGVPGSDGLASMKRRMTQLGGQCDIASKAGQGTTIEFRLPIGVNGV